MFNYSLSKLLFG